ncbi:MAG: acetyltransferase [Novosphingobium sp.]|nr:acetyltransferase [Novosphingobium sp.]
MSDILGVFGAGGCGRGIVPLVRVQFPGARVVFVEDVPRAAQCNDHEVLTLADFALLPGARIVVAVADPAMRRAIVARCEAAGLGFYDVRAAQTVVMDDVTAGLGGLFSPWTTLTSNIRIGTHFHCNLYSYVEHDCVIGDYVTFAPAVRCNGNVSIGDGAYIGAGAVIRQGLTIGAGAVIGMGAIVIRDVPPGITVVGNPARAMRNA